MIGKPPETILVETWEDYYDALLIRADVWDFETTGLYWWRDEAYALAALVDDQPYVFAGTALPAAMAAMQVALETTGREVVAYNAKFDMHFASRETINVHAKVIDPMVALFLIDENRFSGSGNGGLKPVVKRLFGYEMTDFKKMLGWITEETGEFKTRKCKQCAGKGWRGRDHSQCEVCAGVGKEARPVIRRRQRRIDEVPVAEMAQYAGADVWWTKRVWEWVQGKLAANKVLESNFHEVQMPLLVTLYDGEHRGIRIDRDGVLALRERYVAEIIETDATIKARTGITVVGGQSIDEDDETDAEGGEDQGVPELQVNLGSPAQVDWFVYKFLGLRRPPFHPKRKTREGRVVASKWQTDEACLLWAWKQSKNEVCKLILKRRTAAKYIGTYLDNMLEFSHEESPGVWVLYPNFNMTVAKTGRLSSSKPMNFQNQPRNKDFRALYIARPGKQLVIADASQIELRFLAHFSQDPALVGPFQDPKRDLHQETIDTLGLTGENARVVAKGANFGEAYEVYGATFAMQLFKGSDGDVDLTKDEAQAILDSIRAKRPLVRKWKNNVINFIRAHKHVKSIEGLYRRLPEIDSTEWGLFKYAERQGINAIIQGSVKDLFGRLLGDPFFRGAFRLQVHDEVVCEVDEADVERYAASAKAKIEAFTRRYSLRVPIIAEVGIGSDWSAK